MAVVEDWAFEKAILVSDFLAITDLVRELGVARFVRGVAERYRSNYLSLATTVPEFKVWADLDTRPANHSSGLNAISAAQLRGDGRAVRRLLFGHAALAEWFAARDEQR